MFLMLLSLQASAGQAALLQDFPPVTQTHAVPSWIPTIDVSFTT